MCVFGTMNAVLDNIYSRSSVRNFKPDQIPDDTLREILKAGFHAANGVNAQAVRFSIVSDKKKLDGYSDAGKKLYLEWLKAEKINNPHLEALVSDPKTNLFQNAPTVIFIYTAPNALTAVEDASLAAGNIQLAAKSLGLGTCWIGLAGNLGQYDAFLKDNKVPKDHTLRAAITIGYPAGETKPTPRGEVQILNWIK
jgi:nitroreductase